jgi:hypothetical protein
MHETKFQLREAVKHAAENRHGYNVLKETELGGATDPFDTYFSKIYVDTIIHDVPALRYLIDTFGADRILHGTDYAAGMGDWTQVPLIRGLSGVYEEDRPRSWRQRDPVARRRPVREGARRSHREPEGANLEVPKFGRTLDVALSSCYSPSWS